jgi:hypothetical protein
MIYSDSLPEADSSLPDRGRTESNKLSYVFLGTPQELSHTKTWEIEEGHLKMKSYKFCIP